MRFDIPENCHIRWQAALAVLEDLQEDARAPFDMTEYGEPNWDNPRCGTTGCFAGWMSEAPYCRVLGLTSPMIAEYWLLDNSLSSPPRLYEKIFSEDLDQATRGKTLSMLKYRLKSIFKESTGKTLTAPLTFYVD